MTRDTATVPEIPLFDLRLEDADIEAVTEALRSGRLSSGQRTASFERVFAEHLGVRHAVAVANGTAALHLAYLAAGVGRGDEVVVPALTFVATAAAAVYCGATPVFADVLGTHDFSLDPDDVARKLSPRTKAVCVVHFGGYPGHVAELRALCDERGISLVEDASHAPDASVDGRMMGAWGLAAAFSFFSNKVLACGEGGLVATDDGDVAALARGLRNQGMAPDRNDAVSVGFNYRIDEPRAALLLSRLRRLHQDVSRRRELTHAYRGKLAGIEGISVPYSAADVESSSCYVMPILVDDPARRDGMRRFLRDRHRIQTSILYPAIHELKAYRDRYPTRPLPVTERIARAEVTIPLFPELDEEAQDRVVAALAESLS